MRKKQPLPFFENVTILDAGSEGKAIARVDDMVVFVPFVVPGDVVDIKVYHRKKKFCEGQAVKFHQYSERRTEPFCSHFGICGGCKWQHMPYEDQLKYKQQQVEDNFTRIGKFEFPPLRTILPSSQTQYYRNKLEFAFGNRRWLSGEEMNVPRDEIQMNGLGFHIQQMFDRILDIKKCYLQPEPSNEIRLAIKKYALDKGLAFYDSRSHTGFLRNLMIRNTTTGGLMVILTVARQHLNDDTAGTLNFIADSFPQVTSLMYVLNTKMNDVISDLEVHLWKGKSYIQEKMQDPHGGPNLKFNIGPVSFYQTNPVQAYSLYKTAYDLAEFSGTELVYDLYCGTGTITNFIARAVNKVVGVEYIEPAIEDARKNSELNGISNTIFYCGDLAKTLTDDFVDANGKPDVIITDPPRSGMHPKVVEQILRIAPDKVVYVSCNPATQARDIALMQETYTVEVVQPVDMFPQTHHVENVVLMKKK